MQTSAFEVDLKITQQQFNPTGSYEDQLSIKAIDQRASPFIENKVDLLGA